MGRKDHVTIPRETAEFLFDQITTAVTGDVDIEIGPLGSAVMQMQFGRLAYHHYQTIGAALGKMDAPGTPPDPDDPIVLKLGANMTWLPGDDG